MTEDQLEQEALGWLADVGYTPLRGPELAPDGERPERRSYQQVLLVERLRGAIARLIDWTELSKNDWLAINHCTVKAQLHTPVIRHRPLRKWPAADVLRVEEAGRHQYRHLEGLQVDSGLQPADPGLFFYVSGQLAGQKLTFPQTIRR